MGELLASPGANVVHLCIDMQRLFEPGAPWATPWLERALPQVVRLVEHDSPRTVFTRFIPPRTKEEACGVWRAYYEKWESVTREKLAPALLDLVPPLVKFVPPAVVVDRHGYNAFGNGSLRAYLVEHNVDALIVSGGETDVCVLATVLAAVDYGYRVILVTDALCSSSDQSHDALLGVYSQRFSLQIEVTTTECVLERWRTAM
ncbi:cysteine hydrolase [Bradyrhizobium cytisi]|uniref:Cysteine hydrolase n=1 Tax=Bradyrhizobium cytisi TaxID=515489 RepID=A0A5S4WPL6_9BRAD|nr:cysteine hydrolase [Bradyrhizobium cytisi]TYL83337.1 cysteine hydrolase [Bradyrhizobium cytisi]